MAARLILPNLKPEIWEWCVPYQRDGVARAVARQNYHFWWACGAGKSLAALIWGLSFRNPILIFCRASARGQWVSDAIEAFTTLKAYTILPMSEQGKDYESINAYLARCYREWTKPIVVVSWDGLTDPRQRAAIDIVMSHAPSVIADEAHAVKNHSHWKRTACTRQRDLNAWRSLAAERDGFVVKDDESDDWIMLTPVLSIAGQAARVAPLATRRLALTATPMYNALRDLWAQLSFVEPKQHGRYGDWARHFCGAYEGEYGRIDTGQSNVEELRNILAQRRHEVTSEEVWQYLPPCERLLTVIPQSEQGREQGVKPSRMREIVRAAGGGDALFDELGSSDGKEAYRALVFANIATRKRPYVVRTVGERLRQGQKCLVFTGLRNDAEQTHEAIVKETKGRFQTWMAHGGMTTKERERIRKEFMAHPGPCAIVGTGHAWGESLSLHTAHYLAIVQLPWTWGQIRQWEGRVRRLGQLCRITIEYMYAAGTRDMRVYDIVRPKLAKQEAISDDSHIRDVREAVAGGTDKQLKQSIFDSIVGGTMKETDIFDAFDDADEDLLCA